MKQRFFMGFSVLFLGIVPPILWADNRAIGSTSSVVTSSATPSFQSDAAENYSAAMRANLQMPDSWFACESDDDCTVAHVPCGTGLGVSRAHIHAAQRAVCGGACIDACRQASPDISITACVDKRCITRFSSNASTTATTGQRSAAVSNAGITYDASIRKLSKMPPSWFACQKKKDCGLVPVPCGPSFAVNKLHKKEAHATFCAEMGPCGAKATCVQSEPDASSADCMDGQCATIFGR